MDRSQYDAWMNDTFRVSPEGLALYRIVYAAFALLVMAPGHDVYANLVPLAALPDAMFAPPPGPMMLFDGFPSAGAAHAIHLLLNLSLAALLIGYRTRSASLLTGLLFLVVYGFSYSLGKVNHNVLFVSVPLVMAFSGWGAAYSYDAVYRVRRQVQSWPVLLLGVIVGFAMFTAGFAKILGGWLDPSTHAVYGHVLKHFFVRGRTDLLAPYAVGLDSGLLWEVLDYTTVLFEIGFLAALAKARRIRLFAALAVLFHLGIMLTLNISFHFNLIVYAAFVDWTPAGRFVKRRLAAVAPDTLGREALAAAAVAIGVLFYAVGSPLLLIDAVFSLDSDLLAREVLVSGVGTTVVAWLGIRAGFRRLQRIKSPSHHASTT